MFQSSVVLIIRKERTALSFPIRKISFAQRVLPDSLETVLSGKEKNLTNRSLREDFVFSIHYERKRYEVLHLKSPQEPCCTGTRCFHRLRIKLQLISFILVQNVEIWLLGFFFPFKFGHLVANL